MDSTSSSRSPRGGRNKYEVDHQTGRIRLDRTLFTATQYPADYGFIEGTSARTATRSTRWSSCRSRPSPVPDPLSRGRDVPDEGREGRRRQGPLRAERRSAPGAPARHPPPARVRPARDPALLRDLQGRSSRARAWRARPGWAAPTPRTRSGAGTRAQDGRGTQRRTDQRSRRVQGSRCELLIAVPAGCRAVRGRFQCGTGRSGSPSRR